MDLQNIMTAHDALCDIVLTYDRCINLISMLAYLERLSRILFGINQCCKLYLNGGPVPWPAMASLVAVTITMVVNTVNLVLATEAEAGIQDYMAKLLTENVLKENDMMMMDAHHKRVSAKKAGITLAKVVVNREFAITVVGGVISYTLVFSEMYERASSNERSDAASDSKNFLTADMLKIFCRNASLP
ncbi:uncharacterized protein LOC129582782 [Paramacrobiotus metropolitanus]|uniref:uncharacterized protein LOC129582782 n=1 Tax=Paramacrobiotus metropolitanus TaxID=2943436 RepID=UPI00244628F7|nr:uncharacterized protein LOC129582782 [Paramacrobiotus metropolitanus]